MPIKKKQRWLTFLSFFIILNTLFFYGFIRDGAWLAIAVLLVPICYKMSRVNFFLSSLSFLFVTLILIWIVDYGFTNFFFWRPFDLLITRDATGLPIYKKNRVVNMVQPTGDLRPATNVYDGLQYEPRDMIFKTDSLGFRNNSDYMGQSFVLVGDSFIAGTENTQEDTLSFVLKKKYQAKTYSMGVAGASIDDYAVYTQKLENLNSGSFKVLIFVYEGNDFPVARDKKISKLKKVKKLYKKPINAYKSFFRETGFYRFTWTAYKSLISHYKNEKRSGRQIRRIGNHSVGFANDELTVSGEKEYIPHPILEKSLKSIKDKISHMYFIPTKYRIYYPLIEGRDKEPLPNANWKAFSSIAKKLEIPVTNLTPVFIQEAKKHFFRNEQFIFWKDGNHWNAKGISIAAQVVCQTVQRLGCT